MKVKLLVNHRVFFAKGSEIEVEEREGANLLALGFAEIVAETKAEKEEAEEKPEAVKEDKPTTKKAGRPKKK